MKYNLENYDQAKVLMTNLWPKVREALVYGRKLTLEIKDASKSREQEEKYHAIIGEIAKQAQHMGAKWDSESWKRLLVDEFCKQNQIKGGTVIPSLDMTGIVQLGKQTRTFTIKQASEFIEFLHAWAAQNGITLNDTQKM